MSKEKRVEYQRKYRQTHKEQIREYMKNYRRNNKEKLKDYHRRWYNRWKKVPPEIIIKHILDNTNI